MTSVTALNAQMLPAAASFVRRCAERRELRTRYLLLVGGARLWVIILLASTLLARLSGQLHLLVPLLGGFLLIAVSCLSLAVTVSVAVSRARSAGAAAASPAPAAGRSSRSRIVDLAPAWSAERKSEALKQFLETFEDSLTVLQLRLNLHLGPEIAESAPLHQQIGFAEELGIWERGDLTAWRTSLAVRTRILTEGADLGLEALNRHTEQLKALNQRTLLPILAS